MEFPNIVPELKVILASVSKREDTAILACMEKMATKFEKAEGEAIADLIRFEAAKYRQRGPYAKLTSLPMNKGTDMAVVYTPVECIQKAKRLVMSMLNQRIIDELVDIFRRKEEFIEQEVPMPNKLLMLGPPGTGKTITAFHLAACLDFPLVVVRLDSIIDSHLGDTGSNVRKIFEYAKKTPCVLFLDEFDAIARTRSNSKDITEMARVVNTLLQCMDEFDSESFIVAATNLKADLDPAVWRRFDTKMTYVLPEAEERKKHLEQMFGQVAANNKLIDDMTEHLEGSSYAEIEQIIFKAKRKAIMERSELTIYHLVSAQEEYMPNDS